MTGEDLAEMAREYRALPVELRHVIRGNLSVLALLGPRAGMPDPRPRWELRQRHLAHGAWRRFRMALAMARQAYAIDGATLRDLLAEGFPADDRGRGLVPPKELVWIPPERAARLPASPLAMRLDEEMLAAQRLALVAFDGIDPRAGE